MNNDEKRQTNKQKLLAKLQVTTSSGKSIKGIFRIYTEFGVMLLELSIYREEIFRASTNLEVIHAKTG